MSLDYLGFACIFDILNKCIKKYKAYVLKVFTILYFIHSESEDVDDEEVYGG